MYVEGDPVNMIDPSGMIQETPENFVDCVEPLLSRNFPVFVRSCKISCEQKYPGGFFNALLRTICQQGCYDAYANQFPREMWRKEVVDSIHEIISGGFPQYDNLTEIDKFVWVSNTVAMLADNNRDDYLYIMNSLMLGLNEIGTVNTSLTQAISRRQLNSYRNPSATVILIGDEGLHCDYKDDTIDQINNHIWAYTSAAAGSRPLPAEANRGITQAGVFLHDVIQPNGNWQDYLAGIVGAALGYELGRGAITPLQFGNVFRGTLQRDYCTVMGCPEWLFPNRQGRTASKYLEDTQAPLFSDPVPRDVACGS